MNEIELTQQKINESLPALIESVQNGECIPTHSDYGIVFDKHIYKFPMKVLEKNLLNVIERNEKYNATQSCTLNHKLGKDSTVVKKFFAAIEEFKKCIERKSFTDAFEQAMKLKLLLATRSEISHFVGDSDMGLAMNGICLKITSEFFNVLEAMERDHKRMLSLQFTEMLKS